MFPNSQTKVSQSCWRVPEPNHLNQRSKQSRKRVTMGKVQNRRQASQRLVSRPESSRITLDPEKRRQLEDDVASGKASAKAARLLETTEVDHRQVALDRVRKSQNLTQVQLAEELGSTQARVSGMESRPDLRVSTMRSYVEAAGGSLEIVAVVNGERINIDAQ